MRRSAASQQVAAPRRRRRRRRRGARARRGRRPRPGRRRRGGPRRGSRRAAARRRRRRPRRRAPPAGSRRARPAPRPRRRGATPPPPRAPPAPRAIAPERAQDAAEMHPRERRQADVADRLGLLDRELQRGRAGRVVAGLALRAAEARELVGLRLQEAEPARRLRRAADVADGVVEPVLDPGQLAEHRVAPDVQPRVVDDAPASARPGRAPRRRARASPAEIAARAANSAFAAWSHGRSSPS